MNCPGFMAPFQRQLNAADTNGGVNCTAYATAMAVSHATCGSEYVTGKQIRAYTNEPVPDPKSPGLNLPQVAEAAGDVGVHLDVRIGTAAVTWAEYERRRLAGQGAILQVSYATIADSLYDAGNGFRGNHAVFETLHATYDPLADGRRPGVYTYSGKVYDRATIRSAAARLDTGNGTHPAKGKVWAAFTVDVVPDYEAVIAPGPPDYIYAEYIVRDNAVVGGVKPYPSTKKYPGKRLVMPCSAPVWIRDKRKPKAGYVRLVYYVNPITSVRHYVSASYARLAV